MRKNTMTAIPFTTRSAAVLLLAASAPALHADVVGVEQFDYPNGSIAGQSGGIGWNYEQTDEAGAPPSTASDWDSAFGVAPTVSSDALVTDGGGVYREYNGPTEGSTFPSNEREGAFRAVGVAYYSVTLNRSEGQGGGANTWSGLSAFDFTTEKVFFGVTDGQAATPNFGVQVQNSGGENGITLTSTDANNGTTYHLVAAVDFDRDQVRLWVNPDNSDFDDRDVSGSVVSSADAVRTFTSTNWNSRMRLASGSSANTAWDDLVVSTTFARAVSPFNVFADDFNDPNGTGLGGQAPDVGSGNWSTTGGPTINNGVVDTTGAARTAFGVFTSALGAGQTLVLDFETNEAGGNMFSGGFAGISLFEGASERIFIGDPSDATEWALRQSGLTGNTGVVDESVIGKFLYKFDTGEYRLYLNGLLELSGTIASQFALDRVRFANNDGGDISISELVVTFTVPAPAALPAGLGLLSLLILRRRRTGRAA